MAEIKKAIERVLDGHVEAFSHLYNETIQTVYRTLYFLMDDKEELDDVTQEVYAELFKSLHRFDPNKSFHAWVYGLTIRQHRAYRRKRWRRRRDEAKQRELCEETAQCDFAPYVIEKLVYDQLTDQIGTLPCKLREVMILRYLNDLSHEEIADIVQIPVGTVKSRLHSAISRLRRKMRRDAYV